MEYVILYLKVENSSKIQLPRKSRQLNLPSMPIRSLQTANIACSFCTVEQLLLPRIKMLFYWIVVYSLPSSEGCSKGRSMPCVNLSPCTACHKYCSYFKIFILALPNEWSLGKAEVKLHLYSRLNFISLS